MGLLPVVTGISPKEGPPGTRVTIRGENLGNSPADLIGLLICDCDCLLSAEWKSSNKIIARSGPGKGKGDIIVATRSGGLGSCTVQFRSFYETVGPLKESAVWVDESNWITSRWGRTRSQASTFFQQEDPLGLSVETVGQKLPEEELRELLPDSSGDLGSESFSPVWFLLENHHATSFNDLKAGLMFLKRRVDGQKGGQISFLKAHVGSILEQVDTLDTLQKKLQEDQKVYGTEYTAGLEDLIHRTKEEADKLFQDILTRQDEADCTRNALSVLQRFKFLFHLPRAIEKNIAKGDYDIIINDYARAKALFGSLDVPIFKRVLQEADQMILALRDTLNEKLRQMPANIDVQKNIIRHLVNLECVGDPAWDCIAAHYAYTCKSLFRCKDEHLERELKLEEANKAKRKTATAVENQNVTPPRLQYLENLVELLLSSFPHLWRLGQAYFTGELYVRVDVEKQHEFKRMVLDVMTIFGQLFRAALLPHTLDRHSPHRAQFGIWPILGTSFTPSPCLRLSREAYRVLMSGSLDLPTEPLQVFRYLLLDMRVHCLRHCLVTASDGVAKLGQLENWDVEITDSYGAITQTPALLEKQTSECLQLAKETILQYEEQETDLLEQPSVLNDFRTLLSRLMSSFATALEEAAFSDQDDGQSRELRLLLSLSNCQYTIKHVLPRLQETLQKLHFPNNPAAFATTTQQYEAVDERLFEAYLEEKVEPLIGIVEPSMYGQGFDWGKAHQQPQDIRSYAKEILMNVIGVYAEVARIAPPLLPRVMRRVVEGVAEELARLLSCVGKFSTAGALQARADLEALQVAFRQYISHAAKNSFQEALSALPAVEKSQAECIQQVVKTFQSKMKCQLLCFQVSDTRNLC